MDMESSRRPFPRSNEPGLKKPRLNDGGNPNLNGRAFPQRPGGGATNPMLQRFRDSESTYVPQPLQNQELVHQYRTALAELTFNSKPIITNLTIIAGESLHAAKAITGTICANIIEVPSEQKLPSLYLLDSIVKNIGRDYIKHFAARLPEVFCKAYRQVEPPIHQSMRHLFGTWKGVFPAQTLQMIEKELGFGTAANGSSSGVATSRPDSQSQRPGNSIHVNPKYLERQRLQQPIRTKGMISDLDGTIDDVERLDRVASIGAGRSWVDAPVKMTNFQRSTRDALSERFLDKNIGGEYDESDYDSDLPRSSILGSGRTSGNIITQGHDKPWYGGATSIAEPTGQRNGFSKKHGLNYSAPKSANADPRLQTPQAIASRNKGGLCSSWKNSEEEEYMWDDINSGLTDHVTPDHSSNSRKERWISDDSEKLGFGVGSRKLKRVNDMDFATDIADQKDLSALGHRITPPWSSQESHVVDQLTSTGAPAISSVHSERYVSSLTGLSTSGDSSVARLGNRAPMMSSRIGASSLGLPTTVSGANGAVGKQQQIQSVRAASPSGELLMHQHPPSPTSKVQHPRYLAEQDPAQAPSFPPELKASQILGTSDSRLHCQYTEDTLPIPTSNVRLGGVAKPHPQDLKALSSSVSAIQSRHQYPFQQQEDSTEPESMYQTQKPHTPHASTSVMPSTVRDSISDLSNLLAAETAGRSSTSSLLAAVLKSGVLSNKPITGSQPNLNFDDKEKMPPQSGGQPPLPSGRPPTKAVLAGSKASPAPSLGHPSHGNSPTTSSTLPKVGHPPLPPGQPLSSQEHSSGAKDSNTVKNAKDPISSLLSSLVAKGLISASKSESTTLQPTEGQSQNLSMTTTSIVSPVSVPLKVPPSSQKEDVSLTEQVAKPSASLAQSTKTEERNLIGFEFKPDRIRELHPSVIDELFDDLPHTCSICGLRLKLKERLDRHLEWHALKTSRTDDSVKASRGWYTISTNWVTGNAGSSSDLDSNNSNDMTGKSVLSNEPMVPADESQCACVICGHRFEDFYCQESNVWMFKGAVYMTVPSADGEFGAAGSSVLNGPIVHPNCMDENSLEELGISPTRIKLEIDV